MKANRRGWRRAALTLLALICALALGSARAQGDKEARRKLAAEVPIADVHLHLYPGLTPEELQARMDRNNVRWGGAVGPIRPDIEVKPFVDRLGARYIPAGAQPELQKIYFSGGTAEMEDADSASFKMLRAKVEQDFAAKAIRGVGELILNNRNSHPMPQFRRKARIDAPTFAALFELAARHGGFVQIHMEDDGDSVAQLEGLVAKHPAVPVILSHCMARASVSSAKTLLAKHPNLYCETSARSGVTLRHPSTKPHRIFDAGWADPDWLALMEAMPDRFMVGSDATGEHASYDALIDAIRTGLLPGLSEATLKKVAYENAERLLRLEQARR